MGLKILFAEDHDLTRQGIVFGLKKHENIISIDEVVNGQEAVEYVKKHSPDIILMDIIMPVLNGIDATKEIKEINPNIKVIMLTSNSDKDKVLSSFNSGADAYCMKNIKLDDLNRVLDVVINGGIWIDPFIANFIIEIINHKADVNVAKNNSKYSLTPRETEILTLIAEGVTNKDISEKLVLSLYTVKNHVSSIIQKLAVDDRTQVAIMAYKEHLI